MPEQLRLFYVPLLTDLLYIQWDQFIIVQITLQTLYHWVPSNAIFVLKRLHLSLLNIVILLPSSFFVDINLPESKQVRLYSNQNYQSQPS